MNTPLLIKICGITRQEDADAAAIARADMCGFIFHEGSPRLCTAARAAAITTPNLRRVGVFVGQDARSVRDIMREARLDMAQLHGPQSPIHTADCARLVGAENIIRVFWPQKHPSRADLEEHFHGHSRHCAYFLLDAGQGGGGSGKALRWQALRGLTSPRPWLLAGGLSPTNAAEALALNLAGLTGLDFNSGVEDQPGQKNPEKIHAAVKACHSI